MAPIFQENDDNCNVSQRIEVSRDGQHWNNATRNFSITLKSTHFSHLVVVSLKELEVIIRS